MRLLELELKNFGYFKSEKVNLRDVKSATVNGKTGSGKSTLFIDSITWCLFEECRVPSEKIIKLGETYTKVTVTFLVDGQTYKVNRSFSIAAKSSKKELVLLRLENEAWTPLAQGAREAQQAINSLLGADYQLLVSTNFLVQEDSGRFSKARATERKAILAEALRLRDWEDLRKLAIKRAGKAETESTILQPRIRDAQEKVDALPGYQDEIDNNSKTIKQSEREIMEWQTSVDSHMKNISSAVHELSIRQEERKKKAEDAQAVKRCIAECTEKAEQIKKDLTRASSIFEKREIIEGEIRKLAENRNALKDKEIDMQGVREKLKQTQEQELASIKERQLESERINAQESTIRNLQTQIEKSKTELQHNIARKKEGLAVIAKKMKLLDVVPCSEDLQRKCQFTIDSMQAKDELEPLTREIESLEVSLTEESPIASDLIQAQEKLQELKLSQRTDSALITIRNTKSHYQDAEENLNKEIDNIKRQVVEGEKYELLKDELKAADITVKHMQELLEGQQVAIQKFTNDLRVIEASQESLSQTIKSLQGKQADIQPSIDSLNQKISTTKQEIGRKTERLGSLRELETQSLKAEKEIGLLIAKSDDLEDEKRIADILGQAYKMVPIMIMENSIPILEGFINDVLSRISEQGTQVRFETQKALKSRDGLTETLEIIVQDIIGERLFENYSGGEKFQISLAIRIGLSKLLMQRSGCKLETFIIDEGLGTLDQDCINLLRECLARLEQEFSLIIVISHIDSIKGTFPSEFTVYKGDNDSHCVLSH